MNEEEKAASEKMKRVVQTENRIKGLQKWAEKREENQSGAQEDKIFVKLVIIKDINEDIIVTEDMKESDMKKDEETTIRSKKTKGEIRILETRIRQLSRKVGILNDHQKLTQQKI